MEINIKSEDIVYALREKIRTLEGYRKNFGATEDMFEKACKHADFLQKIVDALEY